VASIGAPAGSIVEVEEGSAVAELAAASEEAEARDAAAGAPAGAAEDGAAKQPQPSKELHMKLSTARIYLPRHLAIVCVIAWAFLSAALLLPAQHATSKSVLRTAGTTSGAKLFDTPQQAAQALTEAAENFDEARIEEIFGPEGDDIVLTGEFAQDRKLAADFAAQAREGIRVSIDPKNGNRAFLLVGNENWPFPVPLVKTGDKWRFDANSGRRELLQRRIGANELDAIEICRGYVEAQDDYAEQERTGYEVNQYAQRIVSTPGKHDGLAWQNADGSWGGPIGENIARALQQGYTSTAEPYHGYFFKILKGQGPAAPLGEMDFVVNEVMIGGFALVAAPAEYGVTGVRTFMVSHDGVVYAKDLGVKTLDEFKAMERFNPDPSWKPVVGDDE
jgi:hypothetical protein